MTTRIVRTPTKATGGITPEEKTRLDEHVKLWIARSFRTDPIEPDKIIPAIEGIYAAAGLKKPRASISLPAAIQTGLIVTAGFTAHNAKRGLTIWNGKGG